MDADGANQVPVFSVLLKQCEAPSLKWGIAAHAPAGGIGMKHVRDR